MNKKKLFVCVECGKEFEKYPYHSYSTIPRFCSRECYLDRLKRFRIRTFEGVLNKRVLSAFNEFLEFFLKEEDCVRLPSDFLDKRAIVTVKIVGGGHGE